MTQTNNHTTTTGSAGSDDLPGSTSGGKGPGGMWWVAWRQHRAQLAISLGVIAVVAVVLLIFRLLLIARLQELMGVDYTECAEITSAGATLQCPAQVYGAIYNEFGRLHGLLRMGMLILPVILGAFIGAPMFAREFEQHTQVYVLTQSVGRLRWWTSKVTIAGVPVVLGMLGLGLLMNWAEKPFADFGAQPMDTPNFETLGIIPAAFTAVTIALAATAGIVLRSTVIALAASIIMAGLRAHLLTPERVITPVDGYSSDSSFYPDNRSLYLTSGYLDATGATVDFHGPCPALDNAPPSTTGEQVNQLWVECQRAEGITNGFIDYLPADRRTPLQLAVTGICAVLTALMLAAGALRLHRRVL